MKALAFTTLLFLLTFLSKAQAPQQFSFQGVARNAAGKAVTNTEISLRLTISGGLSGPIYQEKHQVQTGPEGIFTVSVGGGNVQIGSFNDIKWRSYGHYLQVELDPAGGNNYTDLGTTQLLSVPYALHAKESERWKNDDPIIQTGKDAQGNTLTDLAPGNMLVWYPRKGAFRAGKKSAPSDAWDEAKIAPYSAAFGINSEASGSSSIAMGLNSISSGQASLSVGLGNKATAMAAAAFGLGSIASGNQSFASGESTIASGGQSLAAGYVTEASGVAAISAGSHTIAKAMASVSFGAYNNNQDSPSSSNPDDMDRVFQIGNGTANSRSNAFTILRNGNIGIGSNVVTPEFKLDLGSRLRIRNNQNLSAGIVLDDFNDNPIGFVGMRSNTDIGFYHTGKWSFWVDNSGNAHVAAGILQTSDKRLKRNFTSLNNSLNKLTELNGYHYFWKDSTLDQSVQIGVIAQEVEAIFPELVKTDEKGFKSVNYIGLIPHLIEAMKELQASVVALHIDKNKLKTELQRSKAQNDSSASMQAEINQLKDSLKLIEANLKSGNKLMSTN